MDGFQNDVFSSFTGRFNFLYGLPKQMLTCGISHTCVVDESHDQYTKLKKTSITVRGKASIRCLMCACVSKCDYVCVFMAYKVHVCLSVTMCVCSWHIRNDDQILLRVTHMSFETAVNKGSYIRIPN